MDSNKEFAINTKKFLFFVNLAVGITLAIQVLLHPTLDSQTKTAFMIVAIVFVNWAIFTWLAFSVAMKENREVTASRPTQGVSRDKSKQNWITLLDVVTLVYQIVILLALVFLNVLMVVGVTDTAYLIGAILVVIVVLLLVTLVANQVIKRDGS